jgi:hypothetical protein
MAATAPTALLDRKTFIFRSARYKTDIPVEATSSTQALYRAQKTDRGLTLSDLTQLREGAALISPRDGRKNETHRHGRESE